MLRLWKNLRKPWGKVCRKNANNFPQFEQMFGFYYYRGGKVRFSTFFYAENTQRFTRILLGVFPC